MDASRLKLANTLGPPSVLRSHQRGLAPHPAFFLRNARCASDYLKPLQVLTDVPVALVPSALPTEPQAHHRLVVQSQGRTVQRLHHLSAGPDCSEPNLSDEWRDACCVNATSHTPEGCCASVASIESVLSSALRSPTPLGATGQGPPTALQGLTAAYPFRLQQTLPSCATPLQATCPSRPT